MVYADITSFDREVGWGEALTQRNEIVGFHCVSLLDGSRDIAVGTRVVGSLYRGRSGGVELREIATL